VNSVLVLLDNLSKLKNIEIDMRFISQNEGIMGMPPADGAPPPPRKPHTIGYDPQFKIQAIFDRDNSEIPPSMMVKSEVQIYINLPNDPVSDVDRFDPLVHLELEQPKKEWTEDKDPNEEDEPVKPFVR
jgi:hypothetical protein